MIGTNSNFQIYNAQGARQNSVSRAIQQASAKTGVDFGYLVNQANVESSMNPNAKARTSSATGLYQFIDQTWLRMMKAHGAEHGYGAYANAIHQNSNGDYTVSNRATKNAILNLRKDPAASSIMAAELATENNDYLKEATGITPSSTDLYMAHFLGAQGAANFLTSMKKNPWAPAANFFPEAAHSNRGVFYAQGRPLSLQQVYNNFNAKFEGASDAPVQDTQVARNNTSGDFENRVILPMANDWSDPESPQEFTARQVAANANASIQALVGDADEAVTTRTSGFGRLVGSNVLFMAQNQSMQFLHDDNKRYNS